MDTSDAFTAKPERAALASTGAASARSSHLDAASPGSDYASSRGSWRGPAQFQFTAGGVRDGAAQAISPMVIELRADGEVVGLIPKAGCQLSGLATQFIAPYIARLDVSLKNCRDERFNARYGGQLSASATAKEARLSLSALKTSVLGTTFQQTSIDAVLRR